MSTPNIAIVVADFYADIAEAMLESCMEVLQYRSANNLAPANITSVIRVPGALEIPFALNQLAADSPAAMIALGCVIRGETYHFEVVSTVSAQAIWQVQFACGIPIANGVLTVENMTQARARIGKGADAAKTALAMAALGNRARG